MDFVFTFDYNALLMGRPVDSRAEMAASTPPVMQKLFIKGQLLSGVDLSAGHISNFMEGLGRVCNMNVFFGPVVKTPETYDSETYRRLGNRPPEDINGVVMWDDSGASIYIYPSRGNWFTLDAHTCKRFEDSAALLYTYEELGVESMEYSTSTDLVNSKWESYSLPNNRPLNPEEKFTCKIKELFQIDASNHVELYAAGWTLRKLIIKALMEGCGRRVAESFTNEQAGYLRELYGKFEVAIDRRFIKKVMQGKTTSPDDYPFQRMYDCLAEKEAQAAGTGSGKPVLHIGTGWPGTAIGLYRQFNIPVTCIEKEPVLAEKSRKALRKLGLLGKEKLQVICEDGCNLAPEGYSAVIISAMVPNTDKELIIENLRRLSLGQPSDPLLVLRTPADRAREVFYERLSDEILKNSYLIPIADTSEYLGMSDPVKSIVFRIQETSSVRRGYDSLYFSTLNRLKNPSEIASKCD